MPLTVAFQMDSLADINVKTDSTFVLALEAQARKYTLFHYFPQALFLYNGRVYARASPFSVTQDCTQYYTLGSIVGLRLDSVDVILMRQDPPFNMAYITATHLLERIHPRTLVINDPVYVRNAPEKLFVTYFPDLMPPTLITSDIEEVTDFRRTYKDIILKPLFNNGGTGILHITPEDENLNSSWEILTEVYQEPIVVQQYIPEIRLGDKRIILINGEPVGAINRIPPEREARSNLHAGGQATKAILGQRDFEICERIGPFLREHGLMFAGIDIIGPYITEINITSPTGLQEINRFDDVCLEERIWDTIETCRLKILEY